jgi:hypothetical protein
LNKPSNEVACIDIDELSAHAFAAITGSGLLSAKEALHELTLRNQALLNGGDEAIVDSLSKQAVVLEALFYRLLTSAATEKRNEYILLSMKGAMSTHRALLSTLGAIKQMGRADA